MAETSMMEVLVKHGGTLANAADPSFIIGLRTKYVAGIAEVSNKSAAEEAKGESLLKQITSLVSTDDNLAAAKAVDKAVREIVWTAIEDNPQLAVLLPEVLGELKTDVLGERDYLMGKVKQELRPTKTIPTDELSERKDDLGELAELIRWLWDLVKNEAGSKTAEFRKEFPVKAKQEGGQPVKGVFIPDLPKLPRTSSDNAAPVGRAAVYSRMEFTWQGEDIPKGVFVSDVAHDYVSDPKSGFVVDLRGLISAVKESGADFGNAEGWTVEFPTGTLTRKPLVKK
jgi:hypothetical protein